jgi:hypothetical protein
MAAKTEPDPAEAYRRLSFIELTMKTTTITTADTALTVGNIEDVAGCEDDNDSEPHSVGYYFIRSWSGGLTASRRKSFFSLMSGTAE